MIELTKLNGQPVYVNPDLIRTAESSPDTVLVFTDGHRLIVRETPADVASKIKQFKIDCLRLSAIKE